MVLLNLSTGKNVHFWMPASTLQHFFWFKIIKHQFKMAESGFNTVSYISTNDVLYKTRKFLYSM